MVVVPLTRPMSTEVFYSIGIVCSTEDPLLQKRIQVSTAETSGIAPGQLQWAKAVVNHSQITSEGGSGSTMISPHNHKPGDTVLLMRGTGSEQDLFAVGHPGSIASQSGAAASSTGPQNFYWNSFYPHGDAKGKAKVQSVQYPKQGTPVWGNPGQVVIQMASDPDVRKYFDTKAKAFNLPQLYQTDVWHMGMHIIKSAATGSPITQVIQNEDQNFISEAQKNNTALQILHRQRLELNMPDLNGFLSKQVPQGVVQTIQGLMSGGGIPGLTGIIGTIENLISQYTQMAQSVITQQQNQNQAMANNNQQLTSTTTSNGVITNVLSSSAGQA